MTHVSLDLLLPFAAVARSHNLTRSAAGLNVTVSALSQQIKRLELQLGYTLLLRGPRGVTLTEDGRRLLHAITPHLTALTAIVDSGPSATTDRMVALVAMESVISSWLLPRLEPFLELHPEFKVQLFVSQQFEDLSSGRYDAALWYGHGDVSDERMQIAAELLMHDWLVPVAAPSFLATHHWKPGEALDRLPLVGPEAIWTPWFAARGEPAVPRYIATSNEAESRLRAATNGIGVTLSRLSLVLPLLRSGVLVALSAHAVNDVKAHYLAYFKRSLDITPFRTFRRWILNEGARFSVAAPSEFQALYQRGKVAH